MYKLLKKTKLTEALTEYVFDAPHVSRRGRPGQFVLFRVDQHGERIPITLCDTDIPNGTITLLVQAAGASTMQLAKVKEGECIADIVGPLGNATHLDCKKEAILVAGGAGIAVLHPQAWLLRSLGRRVTIIYGARTADQLVYIDKLKKLCDDLIITTDDGTMGMKGNAGVALTQLLTERRDEFDLTFVVGPLPMMKAMCSITKQFNIKTTVSMNPIMIDGTGMCGCCRLTVGGEVKYACVDGPEFDGHQVDFDEVMNRNRYYSDIEKEHVCRLTGEKRNG